jgi:hypothetical protein
VEELVEKGQTSGDPAKIAASEKLEQRLEEILASDDHKWYIGMMSPEEAAARREAAEAFKARYEN